MQLQAIADRIANLDTSFPLDEFTGICRLAWEAIGTCKPGEEEKALLSINAPQPDCDKLMDELERMIPGAGFTMLPSAAVIEPNVKPIEFLWPGWIPRGLISMLAASPGSGKSLLGLDLCRRVLMGEPYPDGKGRFTPAERVMYVDAENAPEIMFERLRPWKIDMNRLIPKFPGDCGYIDFDNPEHRDLFVEEVYTAKPELVVIDAFANITTRSENYVEELRMLLAFLRDLALDFRLALLIIHHLRKSGFRGRGWWMSIDDIRGSGSIIAAARSVMGMDMVTSQHKIDLSAPRRLAVIKTNVASAQPALGFEIGTSEEGAIQINWGEAPELKTEPTKLEMCTKWLAELMEGCGKAMKPKEVMILAGAEGYSERTVHRARAELGEGNTRAGGYIRNTDGGKNPHSEWEWVCTGSGQAEYQEGESLQPELF